MPTPTADSARYCPACNGHTDAEVCPHDGKPTLARERLDPDAAPVHAGDVVDGRYRITGLIGRGGFGVVYAAEHLGTRQAVALKMRLPGPEGIGEAEVRRFRREAQVTAGLRHANTVRVFDVGQTEAGALYIAMERVHGETLEAVLRRHEAAGEALGEADAVAVGIAVLKSLSEAHGQGIVHRDLKPANIMLGAVDGERVVKVIDYGIARPSQDHTDTGHLMGTPAYMSPEQGRGEAVDARTDLYALGVVLYRCVTGTVPFTGGRGGAGGLAGDVRLQHATQPPPDLRSAARGPLSDGFVAVVTHALQKQAVDRPQSAREMALRLEELPAAAGARATWPADDAGDATVRQEPMPAATRTVTATVDHALATPVKPVPASRSPVWPAARSPIWLVATVVLALAAAWLGGMVLGARRVESRAAAPRPTVVQATPMPAVAAREPVESQESSPPAAPLPVPPARVAPAASATPPAPSATRDDAPPAPARAAPHRSRKGSPPPPPELPHVQRYAPE